MKKISEKYGFRMKIFILFLLLVILPYLLVITTIYRMFLDYTGKNWGKSMEDTMISIGNQVSSSLDVYENSTMNLYYSGCVDMLESGNVDKEKVESILNVCCYSNMGVKSTYLVCDGAVYHSGSQYGNFLEIVKPYEKEVYSSGGKCLWYNTTELYGKADSRNYILARALNGKKKENLGILYYIVSEKLITNAFSRLQVDDCMKYMVDAENNILYSSVSTDKSSPFIWEEAELEKESGYVILKNKKRQEVLAYNTMPDVGWTFLSYISLDNLMKTLFPVEKLVIIVSVTYGLFLALVFYLFQKNFLKPISDLKYAMNQFADGNMNVRMEEIKSGEMKNLSEHFNSMTDKINILIKHNQEVINEKNNFKMQILMAKLHPPFIFNALNTIKWMSVINHQENIQKLTEALIYILMNNAGDKKEDYSLKDEEELIKQYAVIQKARFMNFEIEWDLAEETLDCRIFQFLLQPVVENAIVHGFQRGMTRGGKVKISSRIRNGMLEIAITDNGCGFDVAQWENSNERQKNHTNIGLRYIKQIIKLEYGAEYDMEIQSQPGVGTSVYYQIPARKQEG